MIRYIRNIFALSLILFVSVWLYLHIGDIKKNAVTMLKDRLHKATGLHIDASSFSLSLPPTLVVHDLVIKDQNNSLVFEAKQGSLFIDLTDILTWNFKKIWLDIEHGKLHSIPEALVKSEQKTEQTNLKADPKLPEIFVSVNNLDISPALFTTIDSPAAFDLASLKLKNFYFHTSGGFHEVKGKILSDSLKLNDLIFNKLKTHLDVKLTNNHAVGQIKFSSLLDQKDVLIDGDFNWLFGESLTVNAAELMYDQLSVTDATAELNLAELDTWPKDLQLSATKATYPDVELLGIKLKANLDAGYHLHGTAEKVTHKDLGLSSLDIKTTIDTNLPEQPLALKTEGSWKGQPLKIETDVNYKFGKEELRIGFKSLSGSVGTVPFSLDEPGVFSATNTQLSFTPLSITIDETALKGSASVENNLFSAKGTVTSPKYPHADINIQFPLAYSMNPFAINFDASAPLSGSVTAEGDLATILHRLLDSPTSLSGHARAVLNVAGTVESPLLTGNGEITDGAYEIPGIGVSLKDLKATIESEGAYLTIKSIEAVDGKGGMVFGSGYYDINREKNFPFSLELTLVEATLLNQDYVQVVCNGPLLFSGNSDEGAISGMLQVSKASVNIPERSYSTINTVDVTYINIPKDMPGPQSIGIQKSRWPLTLDIHLAIQRVLSIQGKDLDSLWKGELAVQGTAKALLLFGELKLISGQYLFNGNPFSINQGTITFAGDLDKKTTLYVIAGKDLDKVKVDVIAKGPVRNPVISFRSNPPMPQREILSWILFNRGTSEISPFQGAQLSESITNLSTQQQGPDVLSKIRSTFKIDRFEISRNPQCDDNSVNVEVGKYISDNILISVIKSDVNKVAVEANITDNVKLRAQVGDDSQGQLLLKWKKDY